jgi:hypoxanthine phosphoribosyltransferase
VNKLILTQSQFNGLVAKICRDIMLSNWRPDIIVGIGRGGLLPAVMISQYFNIKMNSLDISLRDGGDTVSNCGLAADAYDGANILVVDDINDTGATFNWLMEDWRSSALPSAIRWDNDVWNKTVKFAVVVDNLASECNVKMDFAGMEVNKAEKDVWIEFPYEEWWTK